MEPYKWILLWVHENPLVSAYVIDTRQHDKLEKSLKRAHGHYLGDHETDDQELAIMDVSTALVTAEMEALHIDIDELPNLLANNNSFQGVYITGVAF